MHYVSVCSPNYLHDAHIRLALRVGARRDLREAAGDQPVESGRAAASSSTRPDAGCTRCCSCGCTPTSSRFASGCRTSARGRAHDVCLTYVTARGRWYDVSWKGSDERSGGIVTNIGIHLFDLLLWLFGPVVDSRGASPRAEACGGIPRARTRARPLVPVDRAADLPFAPSRASSTTLPIDHRRRRRRSSSAMGSPICIPASTRRCSPDAASASTRAGRRSS